MEHGHMGYLIMWIEDAAYLHKQQICLLKD